MSSRKFVTGKTTVEMQVAMNQCHGVSPWTLTYDGNIVIFLYAVIVEKLVQYFVETTVQAFDFYYAQHR